MRRLFALALILTATTVVAQVEKVVTAKGRERLVVRQHGARILDLAGTSRRTVFQHGWLIKRTVPMKHNPHCRFFHPSIGEIRLTVAASDGSAMCRQSYRRHSLPLAVTPVGATSL